MYRKIKDLKIADIDSQQRPCR